MYTHHRLALKAKMTEHFMRLELYGSEGRMTQSTYLLSLKGEN